MVTLCAEAALLIDRDVYALLHTAFIPAFMFFFFIASVLEHLFALFVSRRAASLFSLIPAALLLFLFQKADVSPYWTAALLTAAPVSLG